MAVKRFGRQLERRGWQQAERRKAERKLHVEIIKANEAGRVVQAGRKVNGWPLTAKLLSGSLFGFQCFHDRPFGCGNRTILSKGTPQICELCVFSLGSKLFFGEFHFQG
jgi:hypothetical protein